MAAEQDSSFSHLDKDGNPNMVNVASKPETLRTAKAQTLISLPEEVAKHLVDGDINTKKGSVFQTAILAGIMGAKKTSDLIPLCHPIGLDDCQITINAVGKNELSVECTTRVHGRTGVEMEALTGASVAALTIYDMCKGLSHDIIIKETKLMAKAGGKRDFNRHA